MRVLVTGHHGYIGAVLTSVLAESGHEVAGVDSFLYQGCDFGPPSGWSAERRADVRDLGPADLEDVDAVVHLAALSNDPLGDFDPEVTLDVNFRATVALARAAKEAGVERFVFASSCSMYGASGTDDLVTEDAPLRPLTAYAESKARAEEALAELADDRFAPTAMRNATAYGASPRLRLDIVLNNLVAWAHTTGAIRLQSDGSAWRPLVHVRDIAAVTAAILEAPLGTVRGEAFNVGSQEQNYRVRELAEIVHELMPECEITFAEGAGTDPRSYRVDFEKLSRTFPSLRLEWTARRGAAELLDAYRAFGLDKPAFDGDRYVRLRRLRHLVDAGDVDGAFHRLEPQR
jgi:nucleoside-diphosphate-sugar epimerase